jgi:hypothetical protein
MLAPISPYLGIKRVHAEAVTVVGGWGTVQESISAVANVGSKAYSGISAFMTESLKYKELTLDGIAWQLANIVIKEMIRSTTQWVKSGFKGSPAFVTDLEGFLLDIADKYAGNFIWGTPLQFMCSPFKLNIQLALDIQYKETRGYEAMCRLSSAIKNVENFFSGDFLEGGWDGWFNVTLTPSNNPYGQMLEAQTALLVGISSQQGQELKVLEFGRGFLSKKECQKDAAGNVNCYMVTPGSVIETQVNEALGLPGKRLAVADEINELIGALLGQLAKEVLSGAGGLLGLDNPGNRGSSYYDRLSAEQTAQAFTPEGPGQESINYERSYLQAQNTFVRLITDASSYKERMYPTRSTDPENPRELQCASGELTESLASQLASARQETTTTSALINTLIQYVADFSALGNTSTLPATRNVLLARYNASNVPEAQSILMSRYMSFRSSLHSPDAGAQLEAFAIPALREEIKSFTDSIDRACDQNNDNGV